MMILIACIFLLSIGFVQGATEDQAIVKKTQTRGYIEIDGSDPFNIPKHSEYVKGAPPDTFDDLRSAPKRNETATSSDDYNLDNGGDDVTHEAEESNERKEESDAESASSRDVVGGREEENSRGREEASQGGREEGSLGGREEASPRDVLNGLLNEDINPNKEEYSKTKGDDSPSPSSASPSPSKSESGEEGRGEDEIADRRGGGGRGGGGGRDRGRDKQDQFSLLSSSDMEDLDSGKNIQNILQDIKMRQGSDNQDGEDGD